jgi:hypothetical protein
VHIKIALPVDADLSKQARTSSADKAPTASRRGVLSHDVGQSQWLKCGKCSLL